LTVSGDFFFWMLCVVQKAGSDEEHLAKKTRRAGPTREENTVTWFEGHMTRDFVA
jgi:hypothetical protein